MISTSKISVSGFGYPRLKMLQLWMLLSFWRFGLVQGSRSRAGLMSCDFRFRRRGLGGFVLLGVSSLECTVAIT